MSLQNNLMQLTSKLKPNESDQTTSYRIVSDRYASSREIHGSFAVQLFQGNGKSVITFTTSVPNEEVLDGLLRAEINFPSKPTKIDAIKTVLRRI